MLVTVITPVYNGGDFIEETVRSVLSQGYPDLQYLVLNDGSTDDTLEKLNNFSGLEVFTHQNMGEAATVNRGFDLARGELVCVVNADDPLRSDAIKTAIDFYLGNRDALVLYPDWEEIDAASSVLQTVRLSSFANQLKHFNIAMGPGAFISKNALLLVGHRNTRYRYASDIDFWVRVYKAGRMVHIPRVLATHRTHAASASVSQKSDRMADELVSIFENHLPNPHTLSRANFAASYHAGAPLKYLMRSASISPYSFAGMFTRRLRYRLGCFIGKGR